MQWCVSNLVNIQTYFNQVEVFNLKRSLFYFEKMAWEK